MKTDDTSSRYGAVGVRRRPLTEPDSPPPRYSSAPLPAYRHVPGLTPHPIRDRRGHSWGQPDPAPSAACRGLPTTWAGCPEYLLGADLFNRAFLWESHEAWEIIWHAVGGRSTPGLFVQGLIQVSAGLLRRHLGTPRGAQSLLDKAFLKFDRVGQDCLDCSHSEIAFMGLALSAWQVEVSDFMAGHSQRYPFLVLDL